LFVGYEKTLKHEKKYPDDNASLNNEGGRGETLEPPCPSSSDNYSSYSSHHPNRHHRNTSKKPFLKLYVKFHFHTYNGECSVEKLNNWIR